MKAVVAVVGVLILVVVGVVALEIMEDTISSGTDVSPKWEFDDYKAIDGAVGAEGSLELIDTYMGPTIHARDVGEGQIIFSDGRVDHVTVEPAILYVFLMTGQSNAGSYTFDKSQATPLPAIGEAYAWANEDGKYGHQSPGTYAIRDVVDPSTGGCFVADKCPSFCAEVTSITGHKVLWIGGGWGGSSIISFNPDGGAAWVFMKETVEAALSALDERFIPVTKSFMWIQGEADRDMEVELYEGKFLTMVDAIIDGELGWSFDHCFVSLVTELHGKNPRQAQIEAAERYPSKITIAADANGFTAENGLMNPNDLIHYTQLGDNIIGVDLGKAVGDFAEGSDSQNQLWRVMPVLLTVAIGVMAIGLAFRAMMGRD